MKRDGINRIVKGIQRTIPFIVIYSILLAMKDVIPFMSSILFYYEMVLIPILTINITYSFTRLGYIIPAAVLGYFAYTGDISFIGGLFVGIYVGVVSKKLSDIFNGSLVKDIIRLILFNGIIFMIGYALLLYIIIPVFGLILHSTFEYLLSFDQTKLVILCGILAFLMTIDLGGPFNNLAYAFLIEALLNGSYQIIGPVLVSVAIPPLAIYVGMTAYPSLFNDVDKSQTKLTLLSSIFGFTAGGMVVIFRRIQLLPLVVLGSVIGTVFAAMFHLESEMLLAAIPGLISTSNILIYIIAHLLGLSIVVLLMPLILKNNSETVEDLL